MVQAAGENAEASTRVTARATPARATGTTDSKIPGAAPAGPSSSSPDDRTTVTPGSEEPRAWTAPGAGLPACARTEVSRWVLAALRDGSRESPGARRLTDCTSLVACPC